MNNDLISREALKKAIEEVQYTQEFCIEHQIDYSISMQMLGMVIDNAQTVDAYLFEQVQELVKLNQQFAQEIENLKRPQGEWIEKVERRGCFVGDKTVYSYTCPFCGVKEFKKYPFCHCGADLRVKDELNNELKERPQTIGCFNCKHDYKNMTEEPCKYCNENLVDGKRKEAENEDRN